MTSRRTDTTTLSRRPRPTHRSALAPSAGLLSAALSGLLGLAPGCGSDAHEEPDPDQLDGATVDAPPVAIDAAVPDATADGGSKIISETEGTRTFADLTAECDARGGYIQIQAACSGVNTCAGFSYGDWDPGVLSEHSCAGVNGCNGLSCVVLPPDGGKTPEQILAAELPETGPRACRNCHAEWTDKKVDPTKFNVWVLPGSERTIDNWLEIPAAAQARTIAFGKHALLADGSAYQAMAPYYQIYSRAEIERLVEYIRTSPTLQIVFKTVKTAD